MDHGESVNAFEQAPAQGAASSTQVTTPARISMVEMDDWIPMVHADHHEMRVEPINLVMVDGELRFQSVRLRSSPDRARRTVDDRVRVR